MTGLALEHFGRRGVDLAVIETGLGGRLDATNCLEPILTITTDISRDHVEILGASLTRIAKEKAGIIKPGTPHLIGPLPLAAEQVMRSVCRRSGSPLHALDMKSAVTGCKLGQYSFSLNGWRLSNLRQALKGEHQIRNGALVLHGVSLLRKARVSISDAAVRRGMRATRWPGRFQIVKKRGQPTVIVDVCHNPSSVAAFVRTFEQYFPGRRARVIMGFVKRKDHRRMIDCLTRIGEEFHLVTLKTRRSVSPDELMSIIAKRGMPVTRSARLRTAYGRVLKKSRADDMIVVLGSHYLAGEFLEQFVK